MIFNTEVENFYETESYKERNLYYKVFAGYLLNEVIPGYQDRKEGLLSMLKELTTDAERCIDPMGKATSILDDIKSENWQTTFDYHTAQVFAEDKRDDRGEMSDILISTPKHMISIECKFGSNYSIEKDIETVQGRIRKYSSRYKLIPLQLLLLKKSKWGYSAKIKDRLTIDNKEEFCPVIVLFWEDINELVKDERVLKYCEMQLKRKF